uniref:DUF4283 domain-containing protein n=1 Tax=Nicotiana tabacum TaxID=4097 RepID=A0A1S4BPP1_TOBAC|nr:PREDICTED: uncharacterized protein LOC107810572 [Nicotiana tabacum]
MEKANNGKENKNWANLFEGNRIVAKGMNLTFIALQIGNGVKIVQLEKEKVDRGAEKWRNAVIMYVTGETLTIGVVERFIESEWNFIAKPKVYLNNEGYFIVKFTCKDDQNEALVLGPYTINNKHIITKAWTPNFNFDEKSMNSLSRIWSGLGNPLYDDDCITKVERVSYARMLIEMNVTQPLPTKLNVEEHNGTMFEHEITYDWKPLFCPTCLQLVGHCCQQKDNVGPIQTTRNWEQQPQAMKMSTKQVRVKAGQSKIVTQAETKKDKEESGNNGKAKEGEEGWTEVQGRSVGNTTKVGQVENTQQLVSINGFNSLSEEENKQRMDHNMHSLKKGEQVA